MLDQHLLVAMVPGDRRAAPLPAATAFFGFESNQAVNQRNRQHRNGKSGDHAPNGHHALCLRKGPLRGKAHFSAPIRWCRPTGSAPAAAFHGRPSIQGCRSGPGCWRRARCSGNNGCNDFPACLFFPIPTILHARVLQWRRKTPASYRGSELFGRNSGRATALVRYRFSSGLCTGRTPKRREQAYVRCRQLPALTPSSAGQQLERFRVGRTAAEFGDRRGEFRIGRHRGE
jgi:hypothetical protein